MCDYKTTSRQGLKIHNSKLHSKKIDFKEVLNNENNLKKHKQTEHTYHAWFQEDGE